MQGTTDELASNLASGKGKLPQIHLHLSWSEDVDIDSHVEKKETVSLKYLTQLGEKLILFIAS